MRLKEVMNSKELTKQQKLEYIESRENSCLEDDYALKIALIKARAILCGPVKIGNKTEKE